VLAEMRGAEPPIQYLVGTPRGRLAQLEQDFLTQPWTDVRNTVQVKLVGTVSIHRTGGGSGHPAAAAEDQPACPVASQGARG